jgi:MerR family transcriptional regulator/heat shock protein HspR
MARIKSNDAEPCYVISVAAKMVGVHVQALRYYEKMGIITPSRSQGNIRLYSDKDIERIRYIRKLTDDLGVNLAGVEVILRMAEHIAQMQHQIEEMQAEAEQLKEARP